MTDNIPNATISIPNSAAALAVVGIPPEGSHNVSIADAKAMIEKRKNPPAGKKVDDSVVGVVFNIDIFAQLVAADCAGVRFYFALTEASRVEGKHTGIGADDLVPTLVVAGIDKAGNETLTFENSWPYPPHGAKPGNLIPF